MHKVNVLITHGIGWGEKRETYADRLQELLEKDFARALDALDLSIKLPTPAEAMNFRVVFWSPVTQNPQNELIELLGLDTRGRLLDKAIGLARRQMIGLVGDIIAYGSGGQDAVYQEVHNRVHEALYDLVGPFDAPGRDPNTPDHLTMIGHSLGSVITSDFIWDNRSTQKGREHFLPGYNVTIKNIILLGSPMAMYTLRGNPDATKAELAKSLDSPVVCDPDHGLWLNMYDPQDPVGLPLTPIEAYAKVGVIDWRVDAGNWATGWNPLSHVGYWSCKSSAKIIAHKLALDWAALNDADFAANDYAALVQAQRESLQTDEIGCED